MLFRLIKKEKLIPKFLDCIERVSLQLSESYDLLPFVIDSKEMFFNQYTEVRPEDALTFLRDGDKIDAIIYVPFITNQGQILYRKFINQFGKWVFLITVRRTRYTLSINKVNHNFILDIPYSKEGSDINSELYNELSRIISKTEFTNEDEFKNSFNRYIELSKGTNYYHVYFNGEITWL